MRTIIAVVLLSAAVFFTVESRGCPSYEAAVDFCQNITRADHKNARCNLWSCVVQFCDAPYVVETYHRRCNKGSYTAKTPWSPLPRHVAARHTPLVGAPDAASPCGGGSGAKTADELRHWLLDVSMDVYYDRANEHYTEGSERWSGITGHVCPPKAPKYSDCSSTVTWIYWTLFGHGPDFMNGEKWSAGYTGTLDQHGTNVAISTKDLAIGDLCFYYHPMHHVAIYVGGGKVVSHGMDPVGYYPYDYAPVDFCRRYI